MDTEYKNVQRNVIPPVEVTSPLTGTIFMVLGSEDYQPRTLAFRPGHFDIYDSKNQLIASIPDPYQDPVDVARLAALYDASVRYHYPDEVEMREPAPSPSSPPVWCHDATGNVNQCSGLVLNWTGHPLATSYEIHFIDGESGEVVNYSSVSKIGKPDRQRMYFNLPYHHLRRVPKRALVKIIPIAGSRQILQNKATIELSQNPDL